MAKLPSVGSFSGGVKQTIAIISMTIAERRVMALSQTMPINPSVGENMQAGQHYCAVPWKIVRDLVRRAKYMKKSCARYCS
jgi:hypothetical protein